MRTTIRKYLSNWFPASPEQKDPEPGYDLWSNTYDHQENNLVLAQDEIVFCDLLGSRSLQGATVVDVGCGTGRYWPTIYAHQPFRLVGYDVSAGMLEILMEKFPKAETYRLSGHHLKEIDSETCDLLISTLALAHMQEPEKVLEEWYRILKPGADLILTDYHPAALENGGNRSFRHQQKLMSVRSHIHPIATLREIFSELGFKETDFIERKVDELMKPFYEKQNALAAYELFKGVPLIYGMKLKKAHVASKS